MGTMHSYDITVNMMFVEYIETAAEEKTYLLPHRYSILYYSSTGSNSSLTLGSFSIVQ